jgi:hypothetical protein
MLPISACLLTIDLFDCVLRSFAHDMESQNMESRTALMNKRQAERVGSCSRLADAETGGKYKNLGDYKVCCYLLVIK